MRPLKLFLFIGLLVQAVGLMAQKKPAYGTDPKFVQGTFLTTRIVNFMSTGTGTRNGLEFRISHRFGLLSSGPYGSFGVAGPASIRFSFEYTPNGRLLFGLSRSSVDKLFEGFAKYKIMQQTVNNSTPFTISVVTAADYTTMKDPGATVNGVDKYLYPVDRLSYCTQLIIARKFGQKLTVQANGFYIHYNIVDHFSDKNDIFACGVAVRYSIKKGLSISGEYGFRLNKYTQQFSDFHNPVAIGLDLETGGHVFQFHFTNAFGLNETQFIPYTSTSLVKAGVRLGFNISRMFILKKE